MLYINQISAFFIKNNFLIHAEKKISFISNFNVNAQKRMFRNHELKNKINIFFKIK